MRNKIKKHFAVMHVRILMKIKIYIKEQGNFVHTFYTNYLYGRHINIGKIRFTEVLLGLRCCMLLRIKLTENICTQLYAEPN